MPGSVVIAVFLSVAILVFVVVVLLDRRQDRVRLLRQRLRGAESSAMAATPALLRDELLSDIPAFNQVLARSASVSRLQKFLAQGGLKMRPGKFLLIVLVCVSVAVAFSLRLGSPWYIVLASVCAGGALPFLYASICRTRRLRQFEAQFPLAVELIARAVRAGHTFATSLDLVATEMAEPVAGEFRMLFEEQKFGLPLRDALLNLSDRVPLIDIKFFVTTLMIQRETGGNLAEILDKLSYLIRERFKILRQVQVYSAQGRLTMMMLMALPPGLLLVMSLGNTGFLSPLWHDPIGHVLLFAAVILQFMGFLMIRRIISIKV
jgi:tight adherence protein B